MKCKMHRIEKGRPTCHVIKYNFYIDNVLEGICDTELCPFYKPSSSRVDIQNETTGGVVEHRLWGKEQK